MTTEETPADRLHRYILVSMERQDLDRKAKELHAESRVLERQVLADLEQMGIKQFQTDVATVSLVPRTNIKVLNEVEVVKYFKSIDREDMVETKEDVPHIAEYIKEALENKTLDSYLEDWVDITQSKGLRVVKAKKKKQNFIRPPKPKSNIVRLDMETGEIL